MRVTVVFVAQALCVRCNSAQVGSCWRRRVKHKEMRKNMPEKKTGCAFQVVCATHTHPPLYMLHINYARPRSPAIRTFASEEFMPQLFGNFILLSSNTLIPHHFSMLLCVRSLCYAFCRVLSQKIFFLIYICSYLQNFCSVKEKCFFCLSHFCM